MCKLNKGHTAIALLTLLLNAPLQAQQPVPLRDPTMPLTRAPTTAAKANSDYVLSSVLISSQRKVAIINGNSLREGQTLPGSNNVKVLRISATSVTLQANARQWTLSLAPTVIKKNP